MNAAQVNVLLIEDNPGDARLIREMLAETRGVTFSLECAESLSAGLEILRDRTFDVVLLDLALPDSDGLATLPSLRSGAPRVPVVIVMSGLGDEEVAVQSLHEGAQDYLVKGQVDAGLLTRAIRYAIGRADAEEALRQAHAELERRVEERTAELATAVDALRVEIAEREHLEEARLRLEAELRQAQKMEAIGRLAGGVVHDFSNLLTAITGYSELLIAGLDAADPLRGDAQEIRRASERANSLTRQLLAFSRQQPIRNSLIDLNEVVKEMDSLLRRLIGEDIELVTKLAPGLEPVLGDRGQLGQVIVNLAVNARDAMPNGGRLVLETANVPPTGSDGSTAVSLSVRDTGSGMDDATRTRVFEPFFTTKELGKGTGLGLSTVYGIVEHHRGHVGFSSAPGAGTTFVIELPASNQAEPAAEPTAAPHAPGGSETLLLVEDEEIIRGLAVRVLGGEGYRVLETRNGDEALAVVGAQGAQISLVVTDVVMPGISGYELGERIRAIQPGLPLLFMSGYTDSAVGGRAPEGAGFLPKPFTPAALLGAVRDALDQPSPVDN